MTHELILKLSDNDVTHCLKLMFWTFVHFLSLLKTTMFQKLILKMMHELILKLFDNNVMCCLKLMFWTFVHFLSLLNPLCFRN
jgi:acyl-coenzyme A synthetase/AMP-(fatty) acid ligase